MKLGSWQVEYCSLCSRTSIQTKLQAEEWKVQQGVAEKDEKDEKDSKDEKPETGMEETQQQGSNEEKERQKAKSRRLLSTSATVPDWLKELFPLPTNEVILSHVQHRSSTLPHFQIRLASGQTHDGKSPGSI